MRVVVLLLFFGKAEEDGYGGLLCLGRDGSSEYLDHLRIRVISDEVIRGVR